MNNLTNMEPGSQAATVQDPTNKEPRKKECRSAIGAKAQTILEFLRACSPLRGRFHPGNGRLWNGER